MIDAAGHSETGPVRTNNEDCFLVSTELSLFIVADGMGGHAAGEVASRLAVETIAAFIGESAGDDAGVTWPSGIDPALSLAGNRLWTAILRAHERVLAVSREHDDYAGMGTTVVCALLQGTRLIIGHVGDSRLYRLVAGQLVPETRDDTWAATVLAREDLDPLKAALHPMRNVLTNVLGARDVVEIHIAERELAEDELILLCSDGVHGSIDDSRIASVLSRSGTADELSRFVVTDALDAGSRDNVTAVVVRRR